MPDGVVVRVAASSGRAAVVRTDGQLLRAFATQAEADAFVDGWTNGRRELRRVIADLAGELKSVAAAADGVGTGRHRQGG